MTIDLFIKFISALVAVVSMFAAPALFLMGKTEDAIFVLLVAIFLRLDATK